MENIQIMGKIFLDHPWIIILIVLWSFPWKAAALWRAARRGHIGWFLTLFILNTLAILDILYIFIFSGWRKDTREHEEHEKQLQTDQSGQHYRREHKFSSSSRSRNAII